MIRPLIGVLLITWLCAVPRVTAAGPAKPAVGEVVEKMQAFYRGTEDLQAKFKQVFTDVLYDRRRTSHGTRPS